MEVDPGAVAAAAESCPEVARVSGGLVGEVATYLPGRRVTGVRLTPEGLEVHVVARWGPTMPEVGEAVRRAVAPMAGGLPTSVFVEDVEVPEPLDPGSSSQGAGGAPGP